MSLRYIALYMLLVLFCTDAQALHIINYRSPRNKDRKIRRRTEFIILHTTEGPKKGSLAKVYKNGEAHYLVDTTGRIYRVIDRKRVAYHAGVSMWDAKTNLDIRSIGIEVVGYYNKSITAAQIKILKELISELQRIYTISDEKVMTHSMVAYSEPNKWQPKACRGRKRCGMQFAQNGLRKMLGLTKKQLSDPDVKTGRLVVADKYLAEMLYGAERTVKKPVAVKVKKISKGSARAKVGSAYNKNTTLYFFSNGKMKRGDQLSVAETVSLPAGTKVYLGYIDSGVISESKSAYMICGVRWDLKTTLYLYPNKTLKNGKEIDERTIPLGTRIFLKQ